MPHPSHAIDMREVCELPDAVAGSPDRSVHVLSDPTGTFCGVRCLKALTKMGYRSYLACCEYDTD